LGNYGYHGKSVANLGDIDGDGVADLAVGNDRERVGRAGVFSRGAVNILFLNSDGTVKSSSEIGSELGGGPKLANNDFFGNSVANAGDLDGDGVADLLVGAHNDDTGGEDRGAVYVLFMNTNGTVKSSTKIANATGGGPTLVDTDKLGTSLANLGDLDGDGAIDLAVGIQNSFAVDGAFHILRLFGQPSQPANTAPVLDASGDPFTILGVGSRQSTDMRQGVTVASILARGAAGNPITDADAGALEGIAITATDTRFGTFQYTLTATNPAENSWVDVGTVSNTSALLLPDTARIRFTTGLVPHHATAAQFLPLESKLDTGLTFRAWDQTSGAAGGKGDTSTNGGGSAFSLAAETVKVYFEARLFRVFNSNAQLNVYTLEAEFNALTANPALQDRSTSAFTGFTILMSPVPELGTAALFRMLYGVQFNADGTETDMGYRYLTTNEGEATILEGLGRADKRPQRDGAYFREIGDPAIPSDPGVNNRTGILGYIYTTQQPGTQQMTQVYRLDMFPKPTRPGGTPAGSTPTSNVLQQQGDHVYTTNTGFETSRPGTWVVEANRGFVRELSPGLTASSAVVEAIQFQPASEKSIPASVSSTSGKTLLPALQSATTLSAAAEIQTPSSRWETLVATPVFTATTAFHSAAIQERPTKSVVALESEEGDAIPSIAAFDDLFTDGGLLADLLFLR
jgi:hypothetical protein